MTEPRIYVASLSDYNAGILHGVWIDAAQDADCIREEISEMLKASTQPDAEEFAIHDYEGFCGLKIHEYEDIDKVAELARLIAEHGAAFSIYAGEVGADYATPEGFQDAYCGVYEDETDYAERSIEDCYDLDEMMGNLSWYFDYEKYARDLFINDMWGGRDEEGNFHVFRN